MRVILLVCFGLLLAAHSCAGQATVSRGTPVGGSAAISGTAPSTSATLVLCPNSAENGNEANCQSSPVLTFGMQGTSTASMAMPISINNCSNPAIPACTGSGPDTITAAAISGPNASDFSLAGTATGTLASGAYFAPTITFTPTASAGTNESATLTVTDAAGAHTLSLTGTSATVTLLSTSSCPTTLAANTNYQLTANVSCAGTTWTTSGAGVDLNLNGYTSTFSTAASSTQVADILTTGYTNAITVHNGTLTWGGGFNSYQNFSYPQSGVITTSVSNNGDGAQFFNLTFNIPNNTGGAYYGNAINWNGGITVHDVVFNDTRVGTCATVGCRSSANSSEIISQNTTTDAATTEVYNTVQYGGAQGTVALDNEGATVENNLWYPGNATGNNANDFGFFEYGSSQTFGHNIVSLPLQSYSNNRGVIISAAAYPSSTNKIVEYNDLASVETATNAEYSGCETGGAYTIQFDDNPQGTNIAEYNTATSYAGACAGQALRVTDSEVATNESEYSTYTAAHITGAPACNYTDSYGDAEPGCAYAVGFDGPSGFTSSHDTFTGDDADVFLSGGGAANININSPTFNKPSTAASTFHTFVAVNGPSSCSITQTNCQVKNFNVNDATFNTGTSPTDASIPAQGTNQGAASILINWTQTVTVTKASGPAASGATVTFTDTLSNNYTCTTNSSGVCSVLTTQYRLNNDTGASQVENRNPYSLSVSLSGCTTNNQTGLTISATASRSVTLAGC